MANNVIKKIIMLQLLLLIEGQLLHQSLTQKKVLNCNYNFLGTAPNFWQKYEKLIVIANQLEK